MRHCRTCHNAKQVLQFDTISSVHLKLADGVSATAQYMLLPVLPIPLSVATYFGPFNCCMLCTRKMYQTSNCAAHSADLCYYSVF